MNFRICQYCGEPMVEWGNVLSRNPNLCASCSSMADGLEAPIVSDCARMLPGQGMTAETAEAIARGWGNRRASNSKFVPANSY